MRVGPSLKYQMMKTGSQSVWAAARALQVAGEHVSLSRGNSGPRSHGSSGRQEGFRFSQVQVVGNEQRGN